MKTRTTANSTTTGMSCGHASVHTRCGGVGMWAVRSRAGMGERVRVRVRAGVHKCVRGVWVYGLEKSNRWTIEMLKLKSISCFEGRESNMWPMMLNSTLKKFHDVVSSSAQSHATCADEPRSQQWGKSLLNSKGVGMQVEGV